MPMLKVKNEPLVPGIGRRAAVCGAGRRGTLGSGDRPRAVFTRVPARRIDGGLRLVSSVFARRRAVRLYCPGRCAKHAAARRGRPAGGCRQRHPAVYGRAPSCKARDVRPFHHTVDRPARRPFAGHVCALALYRSRSGGRKKLQSVCPFRGTVHLLAGLAATNIIKAVWQRTRFDDMLTAAGGGFEGAFAQFTSWMQPFGNGGSSFPSGHTAAACSVFILTLACDVCLKWNRRRTLVWALCWAYVAFMALCRLVIGRHYLSDTLAAAFVMLLLYLGMRKTKWYRAGARELTAPGT